MGEKAKSSAKVLSKDTKLAIRNFVRLVESAALLAVSVYAVYGANQHDYKGIYKLLTVAAVLIGLRGANEFLRHLAQK